MFFSLSFQKLTHKLDIVNSSNLVSSLDEYAMTFQFQFMIEIYRHIKETISILYFQTIPYLKIIRRIITVSTLLNS